jgi:hypothetical protein
MSRSLAMRSFSACATATCAWITSSFAAVPPFIARLCSAEKIAGELTRFLQVFLVLQRDEQRVVVG